MRWYSRSRSFPGITMSHSRSQSSGMEFPFPFPFPKIGNGIFIPVPVPKSWECNFSFPFPFPKFGNGLSHSRSRSQMSKSHSRSPLVYGHMPTSIKSTQVSRDSRDGKPIRLMCACQYARSSSQTCCMPGAQAVHALISFREKRIQLPKSSCEALNLLVWLDRIFQAWLRSETPRNLHRKTWTAFNVLSYSYNRHSPVCPSCVSPSNVVAHEIKSYITITSYLLINLARIANVVQCHN